MTWFINAEQIEAIHRRLLRDTGGAQGVRERNALESAALRPQTGYYSDAVEMATALLESVALNHPFVDGNKRTAIAATDVFLIMNGLRLEIDAIETHNLITRMFETQSFRFKSIEPWLRRSVAFQQPPALQ